MHPYLRTSFCLFLLPSLVGCAFVSVVDVATVALAFPGPAPKGLIELEGYSLGPDSSQDVAELLLKAISEDEGVVHFTGRAEWSGLSKIKQSISRRSQSMIAVTESNVLFLWWSEASQQYEVLIRLPYEDFFSVELWTPGFGTNIRLCLKMDEIPVGHQVLTFDQKTILRMMSPGGSIDAEKTREVFSLLESRIPKESELEGLTSPCEPKTDAAEEQRGFGESAVATTPQDSAANDHENSDLER